MLKTVLFDWSGTLVDDFGPIYKANMAMFKLYRMKTMSKEEFKKRFFTPWQAFYRKSGGPRLRMKLHADKFTYYLEKFKKTTKPYPDSVGTLRWLKKRGLCIGIVSSTPRLNIESIALTFGLGKFIDRIFCEEDVGLFKPDPALLKLAIKELGSKPQDSIYVGDGEADMAMGNRAKVKTIAFLRGYTSKERLEKLRPFASVYALSEIKELIKSPK